MAEVTELINAFAKADVDNDNDSMISFEGRGLKINSEEEAAGIADEIMKADLVEGIVFKGNSIGIGSAKKIGEALAKRKELKRALWSDMFTSRMKTEIPPALLELFGGVRAAGAQLVELDLSDNAFGPNGARGVIDFLRSSSAYSLEILKLNNNGLGTEGGKMIASALKDCHKASVAAGTPLKLRVFVGGRNRLENAGASVLAESFKLIGTLEEVTMPQNGITFIGITALADAFAHNPGMRTINLSDNTFTEKGAKAIANVLNTMTSLEIINFDDCLLRSQGGLILADSLKNSCKNLQELHLNGNELDPSVGLALVASVSNKRSLKLLEMNGNAFGDEGISNIKEKAKEMNLISILGSFEDDEDVASEEEDDEDGKGEESDDEETVHDEENEGYKSEEEINGNLIFGHPLKEGSGDGPVKTIALNPALEKFFLHPDAASLIALGESLPDQMDMLLLDRLKNPDDVVGFVFGVASLMETTSDDIKQIAQRACETLLKSAFEIKDCGQVTNAILEHLGAIKSENKLKKPSSISGAINMLSKAVSKDWFPAQSRAVLGFVLKQRKDKVEADDAALTDLMKGLSVN